MGSFFPLVTRGIIGPTGLGPYAVAFVFGIGVLSLLDPGENFYLMRRPITANRLRRWGEYFAGRP